jgi:uncharacterized protein DUF2752
MRLVWRRVRPDNFNHELVWLAVSVAAAVVGAIWLRLGFPTLRCPFLAVTGYPCLTCGATRCAIAFLHGNFFAGWLWNPLALVALCFVALFDVYAAIVLVARAPRLRLVDWRRWEKNAVRLAVVSLILANWIYLLAHRSQF